MDAFVTGEPVDRELRRRQLAQRLVTHQARTQTIFRLTGLSRHQLATLRQRWRVPNKVRRRGPPPTSFAVLLSAPRLREEAATLALFWKAFANVQVAGSRANGTSMIEMGECICEVFEAFLGCFPNSLFELEHLVLLARGVEEGDVVALARCSNCGALILADLLGTRRLVCSHCHCPDTAATSHRDVASAAEPGSSVDIDEAIQQELF